MVTRRYPRNEPCPCGSGKKYKKCCYTKDFEFTVNDQGQVSRTVTMTPELRGLMEQQRQRFIAKFGREPAPDDPIFFDPTADTPRPMEFDEAKMKREFGEAAARAGVPPELIYASNKTGLIVTSANENLIPDCDLKEFEDAVHEYRQMMGEEPDDTEYIVCETCHAAVPTEDATTDRCPECGREGMRVAADMLAAAIEIAGDARKA